MSSPLVEGHPVPTPKGVKGPPDHRPLWVTEEINRDKNRTQRYLWCPLTFVSGYFQRLTNNKISYTEEKERV